MNGRHSEETKALPGLDILFDNICESAGLSAADRMRCLKSTRRQLADLAQRVREGEKVPSSEFIHAIFPGPLRFFLWSATGNANNFEGHRNASKVLRRWRSMATTKSKEARICTNRMECMLLRRQAMILYELADILEDLALHYKAGNQNVRQCEKRCKEYSIAIRRAIRNGLGDQNPTIHNYIECAKGLGAWTYLRSTKKGLEKGVKPPYSTADHRLIKLALEGKTRSEARKILIEQRIISSRVSAAAFYKCTRSIWQSFYDPDDNDEDHIA